MRLKIVYRKEDWKVYLWDLMIYVVDNKEFEIMVFRCWGLKVKFLGNK